MHQRPADLANKKGATEREKASRGTRCCQTTTEASWSMTLGLMPADHSNPNVEYSAVTLAKAMPALAHLSCWRLAMRAVSAACPPWRRLNGQQCTKVKQSAKCHCSSHIMNTNTKIKAALALKWFSMMNGCIWITLLVSSKASSPVSLALVTRANLTFCCLFRHLITISPAAK